MKVGITGGIGSGKTSVCKVFEFYGIPVFNADVEAKRLYENPEIRDWVKENISTVVFDDHDRLDRRKLATVIFQDEKKLRLLENKIHPLVGEKFNEWCRNYQEKAYVIYEAAILFETGRYRMLDLSILVTAPESLRIERVRHRDGLSEYEIRHRMARQWDDARKIPLADFVIENLEWPETIVQIERIHHIILEKTAQSH
ncbi:MAG: dephospho-CoA kinase [Bacteroidia bacterium]|nr:dephospho-CoA kinase [Bacteroidia bacterium]